MRSLFRQLCVLLPLSLAFVTGGTGVLAQSNKRPNVIVIMTDDQGYGDLSMHGNPTLLTPNLDKLGASPSALRIFMLLLFARQHEPL